MAVVKLPVMGLLGHLLLMLVFSSCSTNTKVDQLGFSYPAKPENCEITFFKKTKPPAESYETLGKIETHLQKNFFFGGKVNLEVDAYQELRLKACHLGGNAVIVDEYVESSAAEMSHVHVWARVLKVPK
jgi:hypothetical protein